MTGSTPQFIMINGQAHKPVNIPATGEWQLLQMKSVGSYILVHPNGRQAWFHENDINEIVAKNPKFRYTSKPLRDLNKLAKLGLRPFHVDADFDVAGLLQYDGKPN